MSEHGRLGFGGATEGMHDLTENERAWIEFLRLISNGCDPALRLGDVQLLRRLIQRRHRYVERHGS
ncbi:hypothetical protein R5H32_18565 [Defluviimonas sp. D31]|uniref:hypothetical protein n=1 Tax=Defluviimonas sp. D31 TaxID=3083253 RepID=UPI00296FC5BB|nr:hypothetical protein [Defluviimonas sp. D31]MDW4551364.1 hypothetical protein [Defluviimonas sp. D31]